MTDVNVLVLTGYGLNCDHETAFAFEKAGAKSLRVHINALIHHEFGLEDFQILVFGGGFSWGDDHGAGVIQAVRMKTHLGKDILEFVEKGNLVLGICNGFQTLVNLGLLPGFDSDYSKRSLALTHNDCGNFRNDWVTLRVNPLSPCVFTRGMDTLELPVRHGEGKFYCDSENLNRLINANQVALQYTLPNGIAANGNFPENPNGSIYDIAGICDPTGKIFGLMPHPEAYLHITNHPQWTLHKEILKRQKKKLNFDTLTQGVQLLKNGVNYFRQS
jgi:phosphoribosylformylglycinamidine synthase subunit PurQ / glutaminase